MGACHKNSDGNSCPTFNPCRQLPIRFCFCSVSPIIAFKWWLLPHGIAGFVVLPHRIPSDAPENSHRDRGRKRASVRRRQTRNAFGRNQDRVRGDVIIGADIANCYCCLSCQCGTRKSSHPDHRKAMKSCAMPRRYNEEYLFDPRTFVPIILLPKARSTAEQPRAPLGKGHPGTRPGDWSRLIPAYE
jgi:hypothetical protein